MNLGTSPSLPSSGIKKTPQQKTSAETSNAVWYLFSEEQITLHLKNLDDGMAAIMILKKGLTRLPLDAGHWELTGFEEGGNSFTSMNTSKKFVFRMRSKSNVYAGSIVLGCPKIPNSKFKYLKALKYFNRYPFSSSGHLCEMVVGNDFPYVRNRYRKTYKNKDLNLILGF